MTHHAYYIEGALSQFEAHKAELKPLPAGRQAFVAQKFERFGVDDARELIALAGLKNFKEALFFVGASSITTEAQQALLKLLEEPQQGTTFVFLVPHGILLPTVRSRMLAYSSQQVASQKFSGLPFSGRAGAGQTFAQQLAASFLRASPKERSDMIATMLKNEDDTKERVREFVDALESLVARSDLANAQVRQGLEDIAMVRDYLRDRSPSIKMLLEHLALCLPSN